MLSTFAKYLQGCLFMLFMSHALMAGATPSTATLLATPTSPITYGTYVSFTVNVSGPAGTPTGMVTFWVSGNSVYSGALDGAGNATFGTYSLPTSAPDGIIVNYSGDGTYAASLSNAVLMTVNKAATSTTVSTSGSPSTYGQNVTFTASLPADATGIVTFKDGATILGSGTLTGGTATLTTSSLTGGSHGIIATYGGDSNYNGSSSSSLSQAVNKAYSTTWVGASVSPSTYGQSVTFTALVDNGATGSITFTDNGTTMGTAAISSGTATLVTSTLAVGNHNVVGSYPGDSNYNGSTAATVSMNVNQAASTVTVSGTPNPATPGQSVTFTANVLSGGTLAGGSTGTVTFKDGTTTLGSGTLSGGTASFATSALTPGGHTLTATYSGDANYTGSQSGPYTETLNPYITTTVVNAGVNPSTFGQSVAFTATVTSGAPDSVTGSVTFTDGAATLGIIALTSGTATLTTSVLTVGGHNVVATYIGGSQFAGSVSSTLNLNVNQAASTVTVAGSTNPSTYGQPVTFTATVTAGATGTVTFKDGATTLGSGTLSGGTARLTTSSLSVGSRNVVATYAGDANFTGNVSSTLNLTVNQASSTVTVAGSANPATYGQPVTFTATVTSGSSGYTGSVTFNDGATTLGSAVLSGAAATFTTSTLAVGHHNVVAVYTGDTNFTGSTSSTLDMDVNQSASTVTVSGTPNPAAPGQPVTFTATVTAGATGTVTFKDGATTLGSGTLSGGMASFATSTLIPGSHIVTATYSGDGNFTGSQSGPYTETLNPYVTTTVVNSGVNPSAYGQSVTFTATVTSGAPGSVTGSVTFTDGAATLGTAALATGQATLTTTTLSAGNHNVVATYVGGSQFAGSVSATLPMTVNKATATVTLNGLSATYDGTPKAATATTAPMGLSVTITYDGLGTAPVTVGSHAVVATVTDPNYVGSASGSLVISQGHPVITWSNPADLAWGTPLSSTQLNATTPVQGAMVYTPPVGTVLSVASGQTLSVAFTPTDTVNWATANSSVTINVVQASQTITFPAFSTHTIGDQSFALGATASSGLAVTYASSDTSVATILDGTVTILSAGATTITASQDGDSNFGAATPVARTLTVAASTVPPKVTLYTLPDGAVTSDLVLNVSGLAQSLNPLAGVTVNGTSATLNTDGTFTAALQLRDGADPVTVVVSDTSSLVTTITRTVTLDTAAPTMEVTAPCDGSFIGSWPITVSGTVAANQAPNDPSDPVTSVMVSLNGGAAQPATLTGTGFTAQVVLGTGWNELDLTATTVARRRTQQKRTIYGSSGLNLALAAQLEDQLASLGACVVQGTASGTSTPLTVALTVGTQSYNPVVTNGSFQQTVQLSTAGPWAVKVVATDELGVSTKLQRNLIVDNPVTGSGYSLTDATLSLRIALGLTSPSSSDLSRFDLGPMVDGIAVGTGTIDLVDAVLVLRLALDPTF